MNSDLLCAFTTAFLKLHYYNINLITCVPLCQNHLGKRCCCYSRFWKNDCVMWYGQSDHLQTSSKPAGIVGLHCDTQSLWPLRGGTWIQFGRWTDRCSFLNTPGKGYVNVCVCLGVMQDWALEDFRVWACLYVLYATKTSFSRSRTL